MITCRVYRDGSLDEAERYDPSVVASARAAGDRHLWVDVVDPSDEELAELQRSFDLHELAIEDSKSWGQRSKIDFYPEHVFLVVHGLDLGAESELVDREVHLFAGGGSFLITVRRSPVFDLQTVVRRLVGDRPLAEEGIGYHLYLILDEIVDGYLATVEQMEDLSDDIEDRVFAEEGQGDVQADIFRLKRTVVRYRRLASPMREVLDLLQEYPGMVTPRLVPYFRDVQDHVIRCVEFIDNIRDLLTAALESQLAQVSNRLNVVMKQLSAWAGIILVPTLIAGIYGMNFRHMPELSWRLGYPLALGLMAGSALLLYRVFRKRAWL